MLAQCEEVYNFHALFIIRIGPPPVLAQCEEVYNFHALFIIRIGLFNDFVTQHYIGIYEADI